MSFLTWIQRQSTSVKLIRNSISEMEIGDEKDAATDLLTGLIDIAGPGSRAAKVLGKILAAAVKEGLATAPVVEPAPVTPAAATTAPSK